MNELIQNLIEALREEMKEYGEMLARLEQQQQTVVQQRPQDLLQTTADVKSQIETIAAARHEREQRQRHVSRQCGLSENATFVELVPQLPHAYRPLVQALVRENNDLLVRVHQRAQQNHLLLNRAVELMQKLFSSLFPGGQPPTYSDSGRLLTGPVSPQPLYDAIG